MNDDKYRAVLPRRYLRGKSNRKEISELQIRKVPEDENEGETDTDGGSDEEVGNEDGRLEYTDQSEDEIEKVLDGEYDSLYYDDQLGLYYVLEEEEMEVGKDETAEYQIDLDRL
jgi:hypothetical protein